MTWFTLSTPLTAHTLARAKNVNAIFTSVAVSFAKLMDSDMFRDRRIFLGTDTGAVNAYVVTLDPAPPAYVVGMTIDLLPLNTNTGASTINVNGLGAKAILDSSGAAAGAGLIVANRVTTLKYDGTSFRTGPTQTLVTPGDGSVTVAKLAPPLSTMAANLSNSWNPATDDTTDLGQATHRWRNIFFAALAVLNFNNGNYTLTHSSGLLTASGALTVTGNLTATGGAISGASVSVSGAIGAGGTITGNLFSGSGASLTSLPAGQLTGTVASARISGSYTGITGVGALNAGSITSGFSSIDIGSGALTAGTTSLGLTTLSVSGVPLAVNSTNSNGAKIALQDNGTVRGYIGANSGIPFRVFDNSANPLAAIDSSGNLLFGSISAGSDGLQINGLSTTQITSARAGTAATSLTHVAFIRVGGTIGSISTAGPTTTYATSSDENLKTFLKFYDPEDAIKIILADPVWFFSWDGYGTTAVGWGAQTSYRVSKDLATPGHGTFGKADYIPWGIDQGKRTPYLWAFAGYAALRLDDHHNVLEDHALMLNDHETRIDKLESEIASLKAQLGKFN